MKSVDVPAAGLTDRPICDVWIREPPSRLLTAIAPGVMLGSTAPPESSMRRIPLTIMAFLVFAAIPAAAMADESSKGDSGTGGEKNWAKVDGPRLDVGIELDMSGGVHTFPADPGAHEVNVGVVARVAYQFNRLLAFTVRGGYLGSMSYGGSTSLTTSTGFMAPVLVGFRVQLPLSTFRFHIEAATGYAYGNRFNRWVQSGSGASMHQMVVDLRFGAAVFLTSWVSVDAAFLYRLPNVLVRVVDSKQSDYAHTLGATVGASFHF
jgi:hypothetical protein